MTRKFVGAIVLVSLAVTGVAPAGAQAKPNFAGSWKLSLQKSEIGPMAPTSETDTIAQTADEIKVTIASVREQGNINYNYAAKLDGTATPVAPDAFPPGAMFKILSSKAAWVGSSLVISQTTSFQDSKGTLQSTFTLSEDGKTLTKTTHIKFDQGEFDSKSVYDKV
jgi:hypothetical protein